MRRRAPLVLKVSLLAGLPFVENNAVLFDWPPFTEISMEITLAAALNMILLDTKYIPDISAVYRPVLVDNESVSEIAPIALSVFHDVTSTQALADDCGT